MIGFLVAKATLEPADHVQFIEALSDYVSLSHFSISSI